MNKLLVSIIFFGLVLSAFAAAAPVKITAPGEAYGHHGACSGWNGCGDAATCAQKACEANGYSTLVSYGEEKPCTQFGVCELFNSDWSVQCGWGNWCAVMGVTDIVCDNGQATNKCDYVPTPVEGGSDVPEFGVAAAALVLIGATLFVAKHR